MASIHKKGKAYYVVFWDLEGKQVWRSAGPRHREAEALRAKIETELNEGTYQAPKDITLGELADKWLAQKQATLRPKAYATYKAIVARIKADFSGRRARGIGQEEVEDFKAALLADGSPYKAKRTLMIFSAIMDKAVQWGYAPRNPAAYVKAPKCPTPEMHFLTAAEMGKLIEATDERYRCVMMFACLTGCRQSELLGLRWADVDFTSGRVFIRQVLQGGRFYEPKTKNGRRTVAIPPALVEALKTHQLRQAVELDANAHDLVFPNSLGRPMDGLNLTRRVLYPALARAGLPQVRFHDLRHSYISMLMNQGVNVLFAQRQAGHGSAKVTWDVYGHLYPETETAAVLGVENAVLGRASEAGDEAPSPTEAKQPSF